MKIQQPKPVASVENTLSTIAIHIHSHERKKFQCRQLPKRFLTRRCIFFFYLPFAFMSKMAMTQLLTFRWSKSEIEL